MKRALLAAACMLAACGPMQPDDDGGVVDAGFDLVDSGPPDAGVDAGEVDAGEADAGDSGVVDAGTPDAGMNDARFVDAGTDAGMMMNDAGVVLCTAGGIPGTCIDVSECTGTRSPTAGLCPGSAAIQCCTPRYTNSCNPNLDPQPNAGLVSSPGAGGCVFPGMVKVSTYCVDQYEASILEVLDGGATRPWNPYANPGTRVLRAQSVAGAVPQGYITQLQAAAACSGAGKRLCTDAEWLRACRGSSNTTYPYGNSRQAGVCNDARSVHPAVELYGTGASWIYSHIDSPCLNQLQPGLDRSGANAGCVSADQVFDLMGNLHEWTADPNGTFRGGFYVDTTINGNGCLYATTAHAVTHWDYSTGFRCCSDL